MQVISFKTNAGDEIIAELLGEDTNAGYYILKNLHGVQVTGVDPSGALQVRLLPYVIIEPDGVRNVYKHTMMTEPCDVPSGVEKLFLQQTSAIQLVGQP